MSISTSCVEKVNAITSVYTAEKKSVVEIMLTSRCELGFQGLETSAPHGPSLPGIT